MTDFTLQLLHASDLEGGVDAIERAPNFAAITNFFANDADLADNTLILSAGDNYLSGPFFSAAGDTSSEAGIEVALEDAYEFIYGLEDGFFSQFSEIETDSGRVDIAIMNLIGFDASVLGNHEFDLGTFELADIIAVELAGGFIDEDGILGELENPGTLFPYLAANLDFSADPNLPFLFTDELLNIEEFVLSLDNIAELDAAAAASGNEDDFRPPEGQGNSDFLDFDKIAPSVIAEVDGEQIGIIGLTTPDLASLTSNGAVEVIGPDGAPSDPAVLQGLADIANEQVALLEAQGIDKIVLVSHLQQFSFEQALAPLVNGVDIFLAGGSDFILLDENDEPFGADEAGGPYPVITTNAEGDPAVLLSTNGEYTYVGRLVIDFDENGVLIPESINSVESGAFRTTDQGVIDVLGADNAVIESVGTIADPNNTVGEIAYVLDTVPGQVQNLTGTVEGVVEAQDSNIAGFTDVFLNGIRANVRTEETNLGNLSADANLFYAQQFDPTVTVSLQNAGGIRIQIGDLVSEAGSSESEFLPPQANDFRPEGSVSQLAISDVFRFDNSLTLQTITQADLIDQLENGVELSVPSLDNEPGQFPQIAGVAFSFDPNLPAGDRILSAALVDAEGNPTTVLVKEGEFVGDADAPIRVVINEFLAGLLGDGIDEPDGYTFEALAVADPDFADVINLEELAAPESFNQIEFSGATVNGQVDAVAEFLAANHATPETAFNIADTPVEDDERIQNLAFREDTVLPIIIGDSEATTDQTLASSDPEADLAETFNGGSGNDMISAGAGDDTVNGGAGNDLIDPGAGTNTIEAGAGDDTLQLGSGTHTVNGGEGTDTADFSASETGLTLSLDHGVAQTNGANLVFATPGTDTAEIVAFDPVSQQFFIAGGEFIDVLSSTGELVASIPVGTEVTSVAVSNGLLAAAVPADPSTDPGQVLLFEIAGLTSDSTPSQAFAVGSLPDSLAFTPDGSHIIVANEGEADGVEDEETGEFSLGEGGDPEGSISVIEVATGTVTTLDFTAFNDQQADLEAEGVVFLGQPGVDDTTVAQDLEPEFVTVSADGQTAFVTLQENNAIALIDLSGDTPILTNIVGLGTKDLSVPENALDANDEDGVFNPVTIENAVALFQPDAITTFTIDGQTFIAIANEGDGRDFDVFDLDDTTLDADDFTDPEALQDNETGVGDLEVSPGLGDTDGDGELDQIVALGGRSFSILDTEGNLVFDSENLLETLLGETFPLFFNDGRSDDAGPEPEAITVAEIGDQTFLFVGLERSAGALAFALNLVEGEITADFAGFVTVPVPGGFPLDGDLDDVTAPEGLLVIPAALSPTGQDFIVISDEEQGMTFGFNLNLGATSSTLLTEIENVIGTAFADVIAGAHSNNLLEGGDGDDILTGLDGDDTLLGGNGNDTLNGGEGTDSVDGGEGDDTIDFSEEGAGVIVDLDINSAGTSGTPSQDGALLTAPPAAGGEPIADVDDIENILGSEFGDGLFGNNEVNDIQGGLGDDTIHGFAGDDLLDGGDGTDTVLFTAAPAGVNVDLTAGTATGGAGNDQVLNFENVNGSLNNDTISGTTDNNTLFGNNGDDILAGNGGDDTLDGGEGFDTAVFAGLEADFTVTEDGVNTLVTGATGTTTLTNIEVLQFDDALDPSTLTQVDVESDGTVGSGLIFNTAPVGAGGQATATLTDDVLALGNDADFDNLVGFYQIADAVGGIDTDGDGVADLIPEDIGYAEAALASLVDNFEIRAGSSGDDDLNTTVDELGEVVLAGGQLFAPLVLANGGALGFDGFLTAEAAETDDEFNDAADFAEDQVLYFSFLGANPDGVAHLQSLGGNVFGFEDLPSNLGISDNDFNDAVFSFSFTA
jgi:2',3'-cyclic-nucleotide 2'-phosphodiesterase (5'-nucleotidase family)